VCMNAGRLLTIHALEKMAGVLHGFTTRQNGLGARSSGIRSAGDWDLVAEALGIQADRLVTVNQVHGENIVLVNELNHASVCMAEADALITNAPELAIGVETADCVPVLLFDPATPAVAAVHAGWRSTVKKIVQKAVVLMRYEFGSDPAKMLATIGPAIGAECYEVDEPVMEQVREAFPFWRDIVSPRCNDRWGLDLVKLNRIELAQAGLAGSRIHSLGMCTSCRRDIFYSFRAEGRTGRMLSVTMIRRDIG